PREQEEERHRDVEEVSMDVLDDQRERALAAVSLARLAHGARWRASPEGLVVRAAVVVAGETEKSRERQNQESGREGQPSGPPPWLRTEPRVWRVAEQLWCVER